MKRMRLRTGRETGNESQGPLGNYEKQFRCRQVDTGLLNNKCVVTKKGGNLENKQTPLSALPEHIKRHCRLTEMHTHNTIVLPIHA
jgi:hypothetical protein